MARAAPAPANESRRGAHRLVGSTAEATETSRSRVATMQRSPDRRPEAPASWGSRAHAAAPASESRSGGGSISLTSALARAFVETGARWPRAGRACEAPSFAPGETLAGRYGVEQFVARGGMGEVFLARDLATDERVALKTVLSTSADDARALGRLRREYDLASRVRHPNVCRVFELCVHDQDSRDVLHFMVMEWLDGSPPQIRPENPPAVSEVVAIARQLLGALEAIHAAGVLHLDVKRDNVVSCTAGDFTRAVLVDFGLARTHSKAGSLACAPASGSLGYMAPEQLHGDVLSTATDVFSFGVVLYELLTGKLPFSGCTPTALSSALSRGAVPPSTLRPDVPPALDDLALRCLQVSPAQRLRNVAAVSSLLDRLG